MSVKILYKPNYIILIFSRNISLRIAYFLLFVCSFSQNLIAQSENSDTTDVISGSEKDRFEILEKKMRKLSRKDLPGLKEVVDFSVSGVSIQEFLRGLAESNNLNISVDPTLSIRIVNNFTNERVSNILLFLCKEYDLDIRFVGSIMSFYRYAPIFAPTLPTPPKEILVNFNAYNETLGLDLKNDTLSQVAKKISQVSKKNVVLAPGIDNRIISVYIENTPFESSLDKMAYANKLRVIKTSDNFYLLEPVDESGTSNQSSSRNKKNNPNNNFYSNTVGNQSQNQNPAGTGNFDLEVINDSILGQFISIDAVNTPISELINAVSQEAKINYLMFSEPKGNTTVKVSRLNYQEALTFLLQGTEHTYKVDNGIYLIGERSLEGLRNTKVYQLQNRSAEIIIDNIPPDLKKGVDIKYFKELNSLILSGSNPRITEIEAFIKQVDKVVPVIHIEVILVNVSKTHTVTTGITAGFDSSGKGGGSIFPGFNFKFNSTSINDLLGQLQTNNIFNLGRVSPSFYINLNALEDNGNLNIQSTPKLSTLNGHEASLKIGSKIYYALTTQNIIGSLTPTLSSAVQYNSVEANMTIKIVPTVSGDEQVTLDIDVDVTDFTASNIIGGPPPTTTSAFKSMIRIKNEEMIVLGGLERVSKSDKGKGVPILSRIPIIKYLFSNRERSKSKTKQLVFIRPTIIY